jgi:hypothetical protein
MDLKDIAAVSGKGGLFKVVKPTRTGVILESIDQIKTKLIANASNRISLLKEISVYTTSKESSLPLEDVFSAIYQKYGKNITVNSKSTEPELRKFIEEVVPDYDTERVYHSDIKKIVSWYSILIENLPDIFEKPKEEEKKKEAKKEDQKENKEPKKEVKEDKKESKKETSKTSDKPKATAKKK